MTIVSLCDVHKWYDEGSTRRHVLHGVDMQIAPGERVALEGRVDQAKAHSSTLLVASTMLMLVQWSSGAKISML